jgi:hypothetical protein
MNFAPPLKDLAKDLANPGPPGFVCFRGRETAHSAAFAPSVALVLSNGKLSYRKVLRRGTRSRRRVMTS